MHRIFIRLFLLSIGVTLAADNLTYMRIEPPVIEKRLHSIPPQTQIGYRCSVRSLRLLDVSRPDRGTGHSRRGPSQRHLHVARPRAGRDFDWDATGLKARGGRAGELGRTRHAPVTGRIAEFRPHRQTFVFAAFSGHDRSFAGANWYLKQLTATAHPDQGNDRDRQSRPDPAAYAFPDKVASQLATVGRSPAPKEMAHEPTTLSKVLPIAARALKFPEDPQQINDIPATEAHVSKRRTFVARDPLGLLRDYLSPGKVRVCSPEPGHPGSQVYVDTYNLMCVYVLYLDKVYSLANGRKHADPDSPSQNRRRRTASQRPF